jgi:pyridoxal phosphate enzyme (YggS family)
VSTFRNRLEAVEEKIEAACARAGRSRGEVRLMAVSKMHPAEAMVEAVQAGIALFGENRVQEFERKSAELMAGGVGIRAGTSDAGIEVHLIGHLQSNKAGKAAQIFSAVDSLDSLRLAERLNDATQRQGSTLPVLVEIKLSAEEAKTGLDPDGPELRELLERAPDLASLKICGLMTVPPLDDDPETARACFRRLRELRDSLAQRYAQLDLSELSMGMSGDFEIGIDEGSTLVRIGTALFGARAGLV